MLFWNGMATAFPEKAITTQFVAIKNDTLAGFFDFVGADHYFIGIFNLPNEVVSDGLHSQKQCIIIPSAARQ